MSDKLGDILDNDEISDYTKPKHLLQHEKKHLVGKLYKKTYHDDNFSDSSSDTSPHYRRLSHGSTKNYGVRKRSYQDSFDRNKSNYRHKTMKYNSGIDRSPQDFDNFIPYRRTRVNSNNYNHNNSNNSNYIGVDTSRQSYNNVVARMNSFKEYVLTLDDNILPEDAINAYYEYVKVFSNKQLDPFFKNYKECDWLLLKYHPLWHKYEYDFIRKCYQIRLHIFCQLYHTGYISNIVLDSTTQNVYKKLHHFLIFLNILLECGNIEEIESCKKLLAKRDSLNIGKESISEMCNTTTNESSVCQHVDDLDFDEKPILANSTNNIPSVDVEADNKTTQNSQDTTLDQSRSLEQNKTEPYIDGCHQIIGFTIKTIPVDATRDEIYNSFKGIDGFLRAYVTEPSLGKRDFRRAYLSFNSNVNVSETTEKINLIKFRDSMSLFTRPNHELVRRVKCQELKSGCCFSKLMLLYDVEFVTNMITRLDEKYDIYTKITSIDSDLLDSLIQSDESVNDNNTNNDDSTFMNQAKPIYEKLLTADDEQLYSNINLPTENPILKLLTELCQQLKTSDTNISVEYIKKILDPAILYLRIVYSIDYYALTDYPYEHLRNIRCSTITIRLNSSVDTICSLNIDDQLLKLSDEEYLDQYKTDVMNKFQPILDECSNKVEDGESIAELKEVDKEIDNFVDENTQKITDEKYLCPLSMKKFKSPEYVKKHILTKHPEKITQIKIDVFYFNNFVKSRYKNLPFSVNSFKKRNRIVGNVSNIVYPHISKDAKNLESTNDTSNPNKISYSQSRYQPNLRNSRTYGRYRDYDARTSMFDL